MTNTVFSILLRAVGALLAGVGLLVATGTLHSARAQAPLPPNYPTGEIELTYYQPGPWQVDYAQAAACCDSSGFAFDLWLPRGLGRDGEKHALITWGNGTGAAPEQYDYLLRHWASWGFVVIASRQPDTGTGREILDAAAFAAKESRRPGSPLYGKLDTRRIGAAGHSQGATGVVNAMRDGRGFIKTAIPLEIPSRAFCSDPEHCADSSELTRGAVFYVNGSRDVLISPSRQPKGQGGLQSNAAYYEATPETLDKLWATLKGVDHNDMQGQPDCLPGAGLCANGVHGFLGYPTAWLMDTLQGDRKAHGAFISGSGEIFSQPENWRNQTSNITR